MAMFCALHDVEAEEKEEVTTVEGPGKALKTVNLDEPCAQVHLEWWAPTMSSGGIWTPVLATT